ncbi:hypothetical protein N9F53_01660 [Bacteroidia bacterium]|nr:hypothetical protein [Bacteroidia bacterium]
MENRFTAVCKGEKIKATTGSSREKINYESRNNLFNLFHPGRVNILEEIVYLLGFVNKEQLLKAADKYGKSGYGTYI